MRNIDNNFMKLFTLALHLQSEDVKMRYQKNEHLHFVHHNIFLFAEGNGNHNFLYQFIIKELPILFKEWTVKSNLLVFEPAPKVTNAFALCEFMGLESIEFLNLFIPGHSAIKNKLLTCNTSPAEVGDNIMAFLEDVLEKRKVQTKSINVLKESKNETRY